MGEAKKQSQRNANFLKQHPWCCYCGGATLATTIDHVPSRQMFDLRGRPKGLEVPACGPCNEATRQHEQVAAFFGRIYPDRASVDLIGEMQRIGTAVKNNNPGLFEELVPSSAQKERFAKMSTVNPMDATGVLICSGPLLNRSIQIFGAKLGFALYYDTVDRIVPNAGGVAVRWYSNHDVYMGDIPFDVLKLLGPPQSLKQGEWKVNDQFEYRFVLTHSREMAVYFSRFRQSFCVLSWVGDDVSSFGGAKEIEVHRPGQF